jgi:hypothetical protein
MDIETQYKEQLIKSEKWNRISNLIKSVGSVSIAIMIFLAISLPESALNKELSVKEKATLVLDILKEKDPEVRNHLICALRDFYPEVDETFKRIEKEYSIQAKTEWQKKLKEWQQKLEKCSDEQEKINIQQNIELCNIKIKEIDRQSE